MAVMAQMNKKIDGLVTDVKSMKKALDVVLSDIYDPWALIREDSSSVCGVPLPKLVEICHYYGMVTTHCMILGKLPSQNGVDDIVNAHIWPKHTNGRGLDVFNLEVSDLDALGNFLRLHFRTSKGVRFEEIHSSSRFRLQ